MKKEIVPHELEFLLRFPAVMNVTSPVDFLNNLCWGGIKVSSLLENLAITIIAGRKPKNTGKTCSCKVQYLRYRSHSSCEIFKYCEVASHDLS